MGDKDSYQESVRVCQKPDLKTETPMLLQSLDPKTGYVLGVDNHTVVLDDPAQESWFNPSYQTSAPGLVPELTTSNLFSRSPTLLPISVPWSLRVAVVSSVALAKCQAIPQAS